MGASIITVFSNPNGILYQKFVGNRAEKSCVLELWNVDTFEGGTASKSGFLEKVALAFEKKYKGNDKVKDLKNLYMKLKI